MRLGPVRRAKNGYGGMSLRGIPDDLLDDWFTPAGRDKLMPAEHGPRLAALYPQARLVRSRRRPPWSQKTSRNASPAS